MRACSASGGGAYRARGRGSVKHREAAARVKNVPLIIKKSVEPASTDFEAKASYVRMLRVKTT